MGIASPPTAIGKHPELRHLDPGRFAPGDLCAGLGGREPMSLLAIVLLLPLIGFFLVLWAPRNSKLPFNIAFGTTLLTFLSSLGLIGAVVKNPARFTSEINRLWVDSPSLQIRLHLGVDGVNL